MPGGIALQTAYVRHELTWSMLDAATAGTQPSAGLLAVHDETPPPPPTNRFPRGDKQEKRPLLEKGNFKRAELSSKGQHYCPRFNGKKGCPGKTERYCPGKAIHRCNAIINGRVCNQQDHGASAHAR